MKAPWRSGAHKYKSLDDLNFEKEGVNWYWRFIAQIASWMILGGYLILPSSFDSDSQLRFGTGILSIIIVALLTGGYSLTALLWFACQPILFRLDSIFIPIFSVSLFGFLSTMYAFASSSRYSFSAPSAPITLALTVFSAIVYGVLALLARRKISKLTGTDYDPNAYPYNGHNSYNGTPTSALYQDPLYYQNYVQNMHPTAARSPNSFDGASSMNVPPPTEEDQVSQQMARLLHKHDPGPTPDASQNTFRLEWPAGEEEEVDQFGRRRMRTFSASTSGGFLTPGQTRGSRSHSESARDGRIGTLAKIGRAVTDRGRNDGNSSSGRGHQRGKSREERRREIELATL